MRKSKLLQMHNVGIVVAADDGYPLRVQFFYDQNSSGDFQPRFDSHAPNAHPFGLPVHLAPLPAGSVR